MPGHSNRGGARPGAGRPNLKQNTRTVALRIPQDVADILDAQPSRTEYIIAAIRHYNEFQKGTL